MIHLTLTEIASATTLYCIIHFLAWCGRNAEKLAYNEYQQFMIKHHRAGHKGKLEKCIDPTCMVVMTEELVSAN